MDRNEYIFYRIGEIRICRNQTLLWMMISQVLSFFSYQSTSFRDLHFMLGVMKQKPCCKSLQGLWIIAFTLMI